MNLNTHQSMKKLNKNVFFIIVFCFSLYAAISLHLMSHDYDVNQITTNIEENAKNIFQNEEKKFDSNQVIKIVIEYIISTITIS